MNEKKHERFLKVAGHRMDLLICDFRKLGNCASKSNYEYTEREVELILKNWTVRSICFGRSLKGKRIFL